MAKCDFDFRSQKCKDCNKWGECAFNHPEQFKPKEADHDAE